MKKTAYISQGVFTLVGVLLLTAVAALTHLNCYTAGVFGVVGGMALYFAMVCSDVRRDYLQLRALFAGVWIVTISLCQMRFLGYQTLWLNKTWVCVILAFVAFQAGGMLSRPVYGWLLKRRKALRIPGVRLDFNKKGLFLFCTLGTLVSLLCFAANIAIKGYIPFFSSSATAYLDFYTRFYVLCVAGTMLAGPCYYCVKTCKLRLWQQLLLYACILYNVFGFPILVVSRGTFITAAISLSCAIYYLNKRRFLVLLSCLVVMFSIYLLCSGARNYSDAQLGDIFETNTNQGSQGGENPAEPPLVGTPDHTIQLPGKVAFLYSYLTVAHDNMNEAVKECTQYSYGLRQLAPFNSVLRSKALEEALGKLEYHLVRPHLNTISVAGDAYYDFGVAGMALLPFLWALVFGLMQESYLRSRSGYGLLALGNTVSVVALCFFGTWMSYFTTWMFWGVALLLFLASGLRFSFHKQLK